TKIQGPGTFPPHAWPAQSGRRDGTVRPYPRRHPSRLPRFRKADGEGRNGTACPPPDTPERAPRALGRVRSAAATAPFVPVEAPKPRRQRAVAVLPVGLVRGEPDDETAPATERGRRSGGARVVRTSAPTARRRGGGQLLAPAGGPRSWL